MLGMIPVPDRNKEQNIFHLNCNFPGFIAGKPAYMNTCVEYQIPCLPFTVLLSPSLHKHFSLYVI